MNLPSVEEIKDLARLADSSEYDETATANALRQFAACIPELLALRGQAVGMVDRVRAQYRHRTNVPGPHHANDGEIAAFERLACTLEAANAVIAAQTEAAVLDRCVQACASVIGPNSEVTRAFADGITACIDAIEALALPPPPAQARHE